MNFLRYIQLLALPAYTLVREARDAISKKLSAAAHPAGRAQPQIHIADAAEAAETKMRTVAWYNAGQPSDFLRGSRAISPDLERPHGTIHPSWTAFRKRGMPYIRIPILIAFIIGVWWWVVSSLAKQ